MAGRRERVAKAILEELERQADAGKPGPCVDGQSRGLTEVLIDGHVDLIALAAVALETDSSSP